MVKPAPKIDGRSAAEISRQLQDLLQVYTPDWNEFEVDPVTGDRQPKGISAALIGVFVRFCEIIIQRLNQVPDKNFLAFLNLLGASRLPPQPARVPLTFSLTAGSAVDVVVPAGTQVAAPPTEGELDPVIFETDREFVVTAAQLTAIFVREPAQDRFSDRTAIIHADNQGVPAFTGERAIEHVFYIGQDSLFGFAQLSQLDLIIRLKQPNSEATVAWEFWNSETKQWEEKQPASTVPLQQKTQIQNLQQSGTLRFTNLNAIPVTAVNSLPHRWLRGRLTKRITPETLPQSDRVRMSQLLVIDSLQLQATLNEVDLAVESAFANQAIAVTQAFFPFGEKPKFGDTLYLANRKAFSQKGATIILRLNLADPASAGITNPRNARDPDPELLWEFWNGKVWTRIGTSTRDGPLAPVSAANPFQDTTQAFTQISDRGVVSFILLETPQATTINGVENFWIRVRIVKGGYGREARYVPTDNQNLPFRLEPATFVPPIVNTLTIDYSLTIPETPQAPNQILSYNDFAYTAVPLGAAFEPFQPTTDVRPKPRPKLYFGFSLPADRAEFPNQPLSLYVKTTDLHIVEKTVAVVDRPQLTWQYWNGKAWNKLTVRDDSENFSRPGLVEFLPPSDFSTQTEFGLSRYWLRVVWDSGEYAIPPVLSRVLLNTTIASQTITIADETLGSSNATENQIVRTTRSPVLAGQQLQVREPELPPAQEQAVIKREEGDRAISTRLDATGRPQEIWVRWREVSDFYGSSARDRHYVLNRLTGEIQFGNGLNGLIPPAGVGNLRMRYQTGGGSGGNRPAGTIVQLKTTVPYIEKVTNPEAATGGADAESLDSLIERMPQTLRHRGRAVTLEDYEDLAKLASPAVARAKGVPLRNLQATDSPNPQRVLGAISVIVVPHSTAAKPLPSLELLHRIQDYLENNGTLTAQVSVVPPRYLSVSVSTEIVLTSLEGASAIEQAVDQRLAQFLHPLVGGLDGKGWDFGREPYKSDFYRQIESVPGVDHIRGLTVELAVEGQDDPQVLQAIQQTGLFLVHSGKHMIDLAFEES